VEFAMGFKTTTKIQGDNEILKGYTAPNL